MRNLHRRTFLIGAVCTVGIAALVRDSSALADTKSPDDVATKVQAFYDKLTTYQANFTQNFYIKVQDKRQKSTGKVAFQKPGLMSFAYDEPNGNRVISNGKSVKVYEKENEQQYESSVDKSQYPAALAFLMGEGRLKSDFKLRLLDSTTLKFEGGFVLECTPKEASPAYEKLLLYVDGDTSQVRRVLVLDVQGNRNRFDFDGPIVNEDIPRGTFDFEPPKGTKIIKQ
jgi:outer membrane lipoprotein carrier protein